MSYGRDAIGRLSSLSRDVAGTASDFTNSFTYNPASQVTTLTRSNPAYAWTGAYNVNRAYTPNGLNQYANVGGTAFCHDANGNLTADGSYVYLYDVENRLVEKRSQTNTDCAALSYGGGLRGNLRYDPMGRLYESGGVVTGVTRYLVDGDALVAEYGSSGTMLRRYAHGADGKADDPVAWPVSWHGGAAMVNGAVRFLHGNHQGSIVLASDVGGTAQRLFSYDEYGIARAGDSAPLLASNGARFLYTGQAWLPDLGLYHYKARVYSPTLGRFLQTDPIGYDDQINLYAYVANDPVNKNDPSGLCGTRIQNSISASCSGATIMAMLNNITQTPKANQTNRRQSNVTGSDGVGGAGSNRSTPPPADPNAEGPHSRIQKPGPEGRYTTYDEQGRPRLQYRGEPDGRAHGNINRPNVKTWEYHQGPNGRESATTNVRKPTPNEIPKSFIQKILPFFRLGPPVFIIPFQMDLQGGCTIEKCEA